MDGSQKLPQRILGTIKENEATGRSSNGLCLAVAAWMRYVGGTDEKGNPIDVRDPLAESFQRLSNQNSKPAEVAVNLLSVAEVFGRGLNQTSNQIIIRAYEDIVRLGAKASVQKHLRR